MSVYYYLKWCTGTNPPKNRNLKSNSNPPNPNSNPNCGARQRNFTPMLSSMGMRQPFFPSSLRNRKGVHSLTWMGIIASRGCESRNPQHMRRTMVVNARKSNLVTAGNFPSSVGLVSWKRALCCESNDKNEVQMVEGQDGRERLPEISPDDVVDGKVGLIKKRICGYSGDIDMPAPQVEEEVANDRFVWRSPTPRTGRVSGDIVDIPVIPRRELNAEEVISALEANGAMEVRIVNLKGKSTICDAMIFCTAKSVPHMRVRIFSLLLFLTMYHCTFRINIMK